jgi:hypothetical protein
VRRDLKVESEELLVTDDIRRGFVGRPAVEE